MKAIITAAGLGTRSGLNGIIRKELLNVYDFRDGSLVLRPMIDVLIHKLQESGIKEIAVVIDPKDLFSRNYLKSAYPSVSTFFQREKRGFGNAVLCGKDFVDQGGVIVAAGDGMIINFESVVPHIQNSLKEKIWTLFVMKVEEPSRYGVAVLEGDSSPYRVIDVLEKPKKPPSDYALCAFYYLPSEIFNFIPATKEKAELTEAIGSAIRSGIKFAAVEIPKESWVSVGVADDYRLVLESTYQYSMKISGNNSKSKA